METHTHPMQAYNLLIIKNTHYANIYTSMIACLCIWYDFMFVRVCMYIYVCTRVTN